ncbi:hypothetical protein SAMN05660297_01502 [Natronincola peptidivorans]|uniref:Uncharacterized protein n=1 Tax=Natronincola peptidivorans TaxID=426128 RepID=A0A1I0C6C3_9FIRM|nr:hypothetical protein [Natronincola peptidivorans]SET15044.1 hypothetical protein SAMN05660297_01502 [Natronincola peptidivorans]
MHNIIIEDMEELDTFFKIDTIVNQYRNIIQKLKSVKQNVQATPKKAYSESAIGFNFFV